MSSQIESYYEFKVDWYRAPALREVILQYYYAIRTVYLNTPELHIYLTRCHHCGIYFFNDPRNLGRTDIACPFGCRTALQKKNSQQRVKEYYNTKEGKYKKAALNKKRSIWLSPEEIEVPPIKQNALQEEQSPPNKIILLKYFQVLFWLIEGSKVKQQYIKTLLEKKVRQHSIVKNRHILNSVQYQLKNTS